MIRYKSILGGEEETDFETAVLKGRPEDGGLYVPTELPHVSFEQLKSWKSFSYLEVAFEILSLFIDRSIVSEKDLRQLVNNSFATFEHPETIPHQRLQNGVVVQELFHGPTLSFKDVAMGFVVNLFDFFLSRKNEKRTLMVATSGDTGPAAAFATIGKASLSTWLFFPEELITDEQARQMTTVIASNVHSVSVTDCHDGSDQLDLLITDCFADESFRREMGLSSVNSINWARVMTQIVHYFYGYLQNANQIGDSVNFSVPCGAFGNMCAGSIAKKMGLPAGKMIVTNNSNRVLHDALETGVFEKRPICNTLATAIDIAVPMNFWRHIYFSLDGDTNQLSELYQSYESIGKATFSPEQLSKINNGFLCYTVQDDEIGETIRSTWERENYLLDPHGAVAVAGAKAVQSTLEENEPMICLSTAHPAKFPQTTHAIIGTVPESGTHHSLNIAMSACERKYVCRASSSLTKEIQGIMRKVESWQPTQN